jgi:hypothetical protein
MFDRRTQPVEALPQTAVRSALLTSVAVAITQYRLDCHTITDRTTFHTWANSIDNAADLVAESYRKRLSGKRMDVCGDECGPSRVLVYVYEGQPCSLRLICVMQPTCTANTYEGRLQSDLTVSRKWRRDVVKSHVFLAVEPHGTHRSRRFGFALYGLEIQRR